MIRWNGFKFQKKKTFSSYVEACVSARKWTEELKIEGYQQ